MVRFTPLLLFIGIIWSKDYLNWEVKQIDDKLEQNKIITILTNSINEQFFNYSSKNDFLYKPQSPRGFLLLG